MKKRRKSSKFLKNNALTGWSNLAVKTMAMMTASAEVITVRTRRMAGSTMPPSKADSLEMRRMVEEKAEAAAESARAVTLPMASQMIGLMPDMLRVATSPDLSTLMRRQAQLNYKLGQGIIGLGNAAMTPFFKRARANARRLRKP